MNVYPDTLTLRELDTVAGAIKGSAFRAFKGLADQLHEGEDYHVLSPDQDPELLQQLRSTHRIYPSSINVVLLAPVAAQRVAAAIAQRPVQPSHPER